ncbi:MAG: hypothetical protein AB7S26_37160 [Sandaracinaceae bacterium]
MRIEIVHEDAIVTYAVAPHLIICVWSDAPTVATIRRFSEVNRDLRARYPEGAAMVNLLIGGTPVFAADMLEAAVRALREVSGWRTATAHVMFTDGFVGVTVRSFLSTLNLMSRAKRPVKICGDIPTAVRFLYERLEGSPTRSWTEAELTRELQRLYESKTA